MAPSHGFLTGKKEAEGLRIDRKKAEASVRRGKGRVEEKGEKSNVFDKPDEQNGSNCKALTVCHGEKTKDVIQWESALSTTLPYALSSIRKVVPTPSSEDFTKMRPP